MGQVKLVIFDLDGTLFRTETVDIAAINRALAANGFEQKTGPEILRMIGLTMEEACEKLLGKVEEYIKEKFSSDVIRFEKEELRCSGKLYDGVEELLRDLKAAGYTLCICSNGDGEYVTSVLERFGLEKQFDTIWPNTAGITKTQAVELLKKRFQAETFVMVGDRSSDIAAGRENGGISVGVTYGFGGQEALEADYRADSIPEVQKIIKKIFE